MPAATKSRKTAPSSASSSKKQMAAQDYTPETIKGFKMDQELEDTLAESFMAPHIKLFDHQKVAVQWMVQRELDSSGKNGGILADSMGLGKTIELMALAAIGDVFQTSSRSNAKHAGRFVTLIVCPTSVIKKWQEEILTKTTLAEDQIIMYRDKERALYATMSEAEFEKVLREQDIKFILTSYEMIRADSNLLEGDDQYEHQVAMAKHHGTKLKAKQKFPLLLNHEWHRIILDEAHYICNPKSISTTQTCWALKGKRRWAASGTPINNNIGDIASLSQFIGVKEYDYNWWMDIQEEDKKVQDKEIALWRLQFVLQRGKEFLDLPPITEKLIRVAMSDRERKKYKQILDEIIRDYEHMEHHGDEMTRKERSNVLARIMKIRQACSDSLMIEGDDFCGKFMSRGKKMRVKAKDGEKAVVRFQKVCVNGCKDLGPRDFPAASASTGKRKKKPAEGEASSANSDDAPAEMGTVGAVNEEAIKESGSKCGHMLCKKCITANKCTMCDTLKDHGRTAADPHSDRTKAIVLQIQEWIKEYERERNKSKQDNKPTNLVKVVVFSQWTRYLDLLEHAMTQHFKRKVKIMRLDGNSNIDDRQNMIREFNNTAAPIPKKRKKPVAAAAKEGEPAVDAIVQDQVAKEEVTVSAEEGAEKKKSETKAQIAQHMVFLVSLKAGGTGLDLIGADKVIISDLVFNPFSIAQAVDRLHRIGQTRPVTVVKMISHRAIDLHMHEVNLRKRDMAADIMDKDILAVYSENTNDEAANDLEAIEDSETVSMFDKLKREQKDFDKTPEPPGTVIVTVKAKKEKAPKSAETDADVKEKKPRKKKEASDKDTKPKITKPKKTKDSATTTDAKPTKAKKSATDKPPAKKRKVEEVGASATTDKSKKSTTKKSTSTTTATKPKKSTTTTATEQKAAKTTTAEKKRKRPATEEKAVKEVKPKKKSKTSE